MWTSGQKWWHDRIEQRAYSRLGQLRAKRSEDGTTLWNGAPPVPVEHVAEHLLGFSICYDSVEEFDNEEILGCLRPELREIVLNEHHRTRFRNVPGTERFTIAHECGHADVFGDGVTDFHDSLFPELAESLPRRAKRSAPRGDVTVLNEMSGSIAFAEATRGLSRGARTRLMHQLKAKERTAVAKGADSPLVRRAVDHYASVLLMPADLLRCAARKVDLREQSAIRALSEMFNVSRQSMRIQLEYLGLIYGVDDGGIPLLENPKHEGQINLI